MTRLRAVQLHGYKSFATRTSLRFDDPVTAIVGPNGSGKSNVMDALRWAIGAGSGRALRTRRAEDVVFSGGRDRPAGGFAEVTIEFDNSDRWLDLDAAEVEIVRRVHRDGQSEIRVNGRAARLRDVQDLFRNNGLGSGGFALMSQGLVDEMLRLRPHERRQAIEEVGGVRQHRHEMEESRRRRQRAQEHLARARLLRDELAPRLRSLERSARKARRLNELRQQLDEAQRRYFATARTELDHRLLRRHEEAQTAQAARQDAEQRRDVATDALAAIERETSLARKAVDREAANASAARANLRTLEHQQELDQQQRTWLSREITDLSASLATDRLPAPVHNLDELQEALAEANRSLAERRRRRDDLERTRASASTAHHRAHADLATTQSEATQLARRWKAARVQAHLSTDEAARLEQVAAAERATLQRSEDDVESCRRNSSLAREAMEDQHRRRQSLSQQLAQLDSQIKALQQPHEPRDTLRKLVEARLQNPTLADAVFGELIDASLHATLDEAIQAASAGLESDLGRITTVAANQAPALVQAFLDSVHFVDDIDEAKASAAQGNIAVTAAGLVVRPDGVVHGGATQPGARRRRQQLAELTAERDRIASERDNLPDDAALQQALDRAETASAQAAADLEAQRSLASAAADNLHIVRRHQAAALVTIRAYNSESARLRSRLDHARQELHRTEQLLEPTETQTSTDLSDLEQKRDRLAAELADTRVTLASFERSQKDRARLSSLRRELDEVESNIQSREPALAQAASDVADSANLDAAREHLQLLNDRRAQASSELDRLQQVRLNAERRAVEASAALRESESERAHLAAEAAAEGIDLNALRAHAQSTFELNGAAHHTSNGIANGIANGGANGAANGASTARERAPTAVAVAEPGVDELRDAVAEVRAKLHRLGPVDPGAAHEFDSEQARWQSIETQISDLEQTETSLREAERDLEQVIEQKFRQAHRQVDDAFQRYFQLMFRGGKAQLVLTEEPVESDADDDEAGPRQRLGVDIKAQPPGKRVSALGLLSGGERALTAIALLFALLEVRPAPFCVLDEVDAALDEANVERFVTALQERSANTQFILITHNRRTIEQADSIYGVTMGAAGVSRLLSVRVDQQPTQSA